MENAGPKARRVCVSGEEAGQRLDNFLFRQLKGVPKGHVYRLLRTGQVRVNSRRAAPEQRLEDGDEIRLPPVRQADTVPPARPGSRQLARLAEAILFEDEVLLVLNKPVGMAVHGGSGISVGVIEALRTLRPELKSLELVHRLDRDTSGCLMVAKKRSALRSLHAALREGRVRKRYLALLARRWQGGAERVRLALEKNVLQSGERRVWVSPGGKESESLFTPVQRYASATLADVDIYTGRTHQIRVHAAHLHHPVAGDDKYGDREANRQLRAYGLRRMFLHASRLEFPHPLTAESVSVTAPLDSELQGVLDKLGAAVKGD